MEKQGTQGKQMIRSKFMLDRSNLSREARKAKSKRIMDYIREEEKFKSAEIVLVYMDYRCEVETTPFVEELLEIHSKRVFAPRVEGMNINFYEINKIEDLAEGYQSIREPEPDENKKFSKVLAQSKQCIVLVPGAVFDRQMGRMGYGKGFYDRFLSEYPEPYRLAPAFECQIAKKVPVETHDIRMNMIITENGKMEIN